MAKRLICLASTVLLAAGSAGAQNAEAQKEVRWNAPFGGRFSANFTVASDYSYAGISNTQLQPAYQAGLDYRSADLLSAPQVWFYLSAWGSNVSFPASGPAVEIDLLGGLKTRLMDGRLKLDVGYLRYTYPGTPAELAYGYGEFHVQADYDFGPVNISARVRHSPDFFGKSGASWTKRGRLGVPLDFLPWPSGVSVEAYGTLGNFWVDNFIRDGLPTNEYWYWQTGVVVWAVGLEFHLAYTATSLSYENCGYTAYCSGRLFASVTKTF